MSGLRAPGDPHTSTIFWYVVRLHLLYSASSAVPREPGSSDSIVSGYGLDDQAIEVRCPAEVK
jgi:hypothetical protein